MANALYDVARYKFANGEISWPTGAIKVALVDTGQYSVNLSTDTSMANIAVGAIIAGPLSLNNKTIESNGAVNGDDLTFSTVSGNSIEAIVIYLEIDALTPASNPLIAYIDTATGLPITPNGGDIIVTWDNGTNKIFRL